MKNNIALLLCSVFISLLIAELILRALNYEKTTHSALSGFHQYDKELGWTLIPNFESNFTHRDFTVKIKANSRGFRDEEYDYQKPISKKRIVGLGDSFTWGWGVEKNEIYLEIAESLNSGIEILNMGHNGYGTGQEYLYFKKFGEKYSPDLVTIAFYENDVPNNATRRGPVFDIVNDELILTIIPMDHSLEDRIKTFLVKYSHIFALINYGNQVIKEKINSFERITIFEKKGKSRILPRYRRNVDEEMEEKWKIVERILLELYRASNKKLLVIYIPGRIQIEKDRKIFEAYYADVENYDFDYPNKRLQRFTEQSGIYYLDLVEPFRKEYKNNKELYFEHDGHWSKYGHRLAGEMLAKKLKEIFNSDVN